MPQASAPAPRWQHPTLYPFTPRFFRQPHGWHQAYLDEGQGEPLVMVHGNPTWSFYFREVVRRFQNRYRCLAIDHIGCGSSDQPAAEEYDYSLQSRIDDLTRLLDAANLREPVTLIVQDWGGMIGLSWAIRHPERVRRIIATNTGAFPLPAGKRFPTPLWWGRNTKLGAWLILRLNLFARLAARWCVTRRPLPPEVRAGYLAPHATPAQRLSTLRFVQTIPLSPADPGWEQIQQTAAGLKQFQQTPALLLWGLQDFVFDRHFLAEFQRVWPHAETVTWPDCGHYLLEDAGPEVLDRIEAFLQAHPAR